MCNSLHRDSKPIKKKGVAYKIVDKSDSEYKSLICKVIYDNIIDGWITYNGREDGFSFIPTLEKAKEIAREWVSIACFNNNKIAVVEVEYKNGLGKHIEDQFVDSNPEILIAKAFKFGEEIEVLTKKRG